MSSNGKALKNMNIILAFLQANFLVAGIGVVVFYVGFLNLGTIERNLDRSYYFKGLSTQIITRAEDILIPTGFPDTILEGVIDDAAVRQDIQNHIRSAFSGERYVIDTEKMADLLQANMDTFLTEQEYEVSQEEIDGIIQVLINHYERHIEFPFISQLARLVNIYRPLMIGASLGSAVLFLLTSTFIYRINNWRHRVFRYWAYGLGGGGLLLLGIPFAIKLNGFYTRLAINPRFVYNFFITHMDSGLSLFMIAGGVCIALSIVNAWVSTQKVSKLKRRSRVNA